MKAMEVRIKEAAAEAEDAALEVVAVAASRSAFPLVKCSTPSSTLVKIRTQQWPQLQESVSAVRPHRPPPPPQRRDAHLSRGGQMEVAR